MKIAHANLLACTTALFLTASSVASAAVATASLDWSNLQIFALAIPGHGTPDYSLTQKQTSWSPSTSNFDSNDSHTHNANNWTSTAHIVSDVLGAKGEALASPTAFSSRAFASESVGTLFSQNSASGNVARSAGVEVTGPVALVISVPYTMSVDALPFGEFASATVSGSLSGFFGGNFDSSTSTFSLQSFFSNPASQSGSLLFGLVVDGPAFLNLSFSTSSSASAFIASVPEASTVWTLIAGLSMTAFLFGRRVIAE